MKIAVMGAGAVGCYYGGMLARAGHQVTLIGRERLVKAVREHGLHMETTRFDETVQLAADTSPQAVADAELVLFCVKSDDTESAGRAIASHLAERATVLSLQNGVDNAERLTQALGREAVPAVVYVAVGMAGPGHVKHHGRGELVIGPSTHSQSIAEQLSDAGVPTQVSEGVLEALWSKLTINCAYNALSAITQLPYGELIEGEGVVDTMRAVFDECRAVADADGIAIKPGLWQPLLALAQQMPGQYASTAQDLARGKRSEIDHLNGYVITRGQAHGIATPANRTLHTLVRLIENKRDRQST
ncbi:2-dehydropantoate 2-reductase [Oleiagrimonas sp. C23AA]|uniref:ketopantoate reductase family protein n=1 Tax=Oleiagrimonas sp. C23AA TaxID=2719047 RepID=UPI0014227312|nr:2-dehydropantoate 2-reductase [Oleiagrimonas sp. C23AA]NII09874.1 2-dehydropantoate 2-reductase [Oleiagrimonas sp. C23AA]